MAQRTSNSRGSSRSGEGTMAEREYRKYATGDNGDVGADPDVLLDVPVLKVDSIHLELDDLDAHVALKAQVLDLVKLNVGVDVHLGKVRLDIKGVEAQALLKVRLDHIAAIIDRVLTTIDRNPELLESLGTAVEDIGSGAGDALGETGEAVEDVGKGAEGALQDVGQGAGQAVGEVGQGAGQAVGNLGQTVGGLGQTVGQVGQGAGEAADQLGQAPQQNGGPQGGGQIAKGVAKTLAHEIGAAASDEVKDLGTAAARKARELGERRRQRRADKHNATPAAVKIANEEGIDLDEVDGSGADGRITVNDVREALKA